MVCHKHIGYFQLRTWEYKIFTGLEALWNTLFTEGLKVEKSVIFITLSGYSYERVKSNYNLICPVTSWSIRSSPAEENKSIGRNKSFQIFQESFPKTNNKWKYLRYCR